MIVRSPPTSIITIPNENISDSLITWESPSKISGAVHTEGKTKSRPAFLIRAILARTKSAIRAFPDVSTRIPDWVYSISQGCARVSSVIYPFEVSMDHAARVKIIKPSGNAKQLRVG